MSHSSINSSLAFELLCSKIGWGHYWFCSYIIKFEYQTAELTVHPGCNKLLFMVSLSLFFFLINNVLNKLYFSEDT